jgi:hypothetical protein
MPSFTTRIELHHASREDYETLHQRMRAGGFSTTITGSNGKTYHLPPAEYRISAQWNVETVRDTAYAIAATVKQNPAVLVTEGDNCAWHGLAEVNAFAKAW